MITPSSERGLSEVLGAILMFALVFSLLVIVQVFAVPTANAQIELTHSEAVEGDFADLAVTSDRVAKLGGSERVSIDAGVRYPSRLFLINPPPASYTFASGGVETVSLTNVKATDDEAAEYFRFAESDSDPEKRSFDIQTRSYTHRTNYNQYTEAPELRIEGGTMYERSENDYVSIVTNGSLVEGRRISLLTYEGDIAVGGSQTLDLSLASVTGPAERITVRDTSTPGAPTEIKLTVHTELSEEFWETKLLKEEFDPDEADDTAFVNDIQCDVAGSTYELPCNGPLTLTFDSGVVYELTVSKISLEGGDALGAKYLVNGGPAEPAISSSGTDITVQVRDELNNPVSGQTVTFKSEDGTFDAPDDEVTTDQDGFATARFTPDPEKNTVDVTVEYNLDGKDGISNYEQVKYTGLTVDGGAPTSPGLPSAGQGGESEWTPTDNGETFTLPNGKWTDISKIESITVSDGEEVTTVRCEVSTIPAGTLFGDKCTDVDRLQLSFAVTGSSPSDPTIYFVNLLLEDANRDDDYDGDYDGDSLDVVTVPEKPGQNEKVTYNDIRRVQIVDSAGNVIVDESLGKAASLDVLTPTGIDLLDASNYDVLAGQQPALQTELDKIKLSNAAWFTTTVEGRIDVTIEEA